MRPAFIWRTAMKAEFSKSPIVHAVAAAFLVGIALPGHAQSPGTRSDTDRGAGGAGTAAGGASGTETSSTAGTSSGAGSGAGSRSGAGSESGTGSQSRSQSESRPARIENRTAPDSTAITPGGGDPPGRGAVRGSDTGLGTFGGNTMSSPGPGRGSSMGSGGTGGASSGGGGAMSNPGMGGGSLGASGAKGHTPPAGSN
jgi:hypothetical protein